jgi:hypothetical protein
VRTWYRSLLGVHRVCGLALCVLLTVWFASGMVMLFVSYPGLEEHGRTAPLVLPEGMPAPDSFPAAALAPLPEVSLRMIAGRATWLFFDAAGRRRALVADRLLPPAQMEARNDGETILSRPDQWTLAESLKPFFPLLRRSLDDPAGTVEYYSVVTGERLQRTQRLQRFWIALGPVVHWIYPAALRRQRAVWRGLVIGLAAGGAVLCASGLACGIWVRRRRRGTWFSSPYRKRAPRLHHQLGLLFGAFGFTWTLSGALSLNPGHWSSGDRPSAEERLRYSGGAVEIARFVRPPQQVLTACQAQGPIDALVLIQLAGHPWYRCDASTGRSLWTPADHEAPAWLGAPPALLVDAARLVRPQSQVVRTVRALQPDDYYYPTHAAPDVELPYLRVEFDDDAATCLYLGSVTGSLLRRFERTGRWERWAYHGLHSFDISPLYEHSSPWRILLLTVLAGGAALAASGVWLSVRWLRRQVRSNV